MVNAKLSGRGKSWKAIRKALLTAAILAAAALALPLLAGNAAAEPYMSVREGYKCSKCHVNRTGGGKRTDYAQVYMHTRMAHNPLYPAAEGAKTEEAPSFATGRLSETFSVGADFRTSLHKISTPGATNDVSGFNRPTECSGCHTSTSGGGKVAELYLQMDAVPGRFAMVASQNLAPSADSRELYALITDLPLEGFVKTGTFRLPTGLHNTYDDPFAHGVGRQNYGFSGVPGLESVRGTGVEVGVEPGDFSVTLSVTNPSAPTQVVDDFRYSLFAYGVRPWGLLGLLYYDDPLTANLTRTVNSGLLGLHFGRFTGLAHLFVITEKTLDTGAEFSYRAATLELNYLISKGNNAKVQYEFVDPDMDGGGDLVDRLSLIYEPFVTPTLQLRVGVRNYTGPADADAANAGVIFLEGHFLY